MYKVLNFISPSDLMKSSCGWMKACLIQHMFCSRESTNYLMIQQDKKSTQIYFLMLSYHQSEPITQNHKVMRAKLASFSYCPLVKIQRGHNTLHNACHKESFFVHYPLFQFHRSYLSHNCNCKIVKTLDFMSLM